MPKKKKPANKKADLQAACEMVERHARSIGKDCQVIFTDDGVEVAPLSWSGSATASSLFEALMDAKETAEQ